MQYMSSLIVVKDMEASKRFYTGLMEMHITSDFGANVVLDERLALQTSESWATFCHRAEDSFHFGGGAFELYFEVDDFDSFMQRLKADWPQVGIECDVETFPWGQRSIKLADPDGHWVEVGENMKTVTKRYLLEGLSNEETQKRVLYPMPLVLMCREELEAEGKL